MRTTRGATVSELLMVLGAMGILTSAGVSAYFKISSNAGQTKLKSDVQVLNSAVTCFLGMGGKLNDVEKPERVLSRLRFVNEQVIARRMPGAVGACIDPKLTFRSQDAAEASSNDPRVYWNQTKQRFEMKTSGPIGGIAEFYIDPNMDVADAEYVERNFANLYAKETTWVWDYQEQGMPPLLTPTQIATGLEDPETTPGGGGGGGPAAGVSQTLLPPVFSVPSGTYTIRDYDIEVFLSNPNDETISDVYYQGDFGTWKKYVPGSPIMVEPDRTIVAQTVARVPEYKDSNSVSEVYNASPVQLLKPNIYVSAGRFGLIWRDQVIAVQLEDTNGSDPSEIVYRLNSGGWTDYENVFFVERADYPGGVLIEAKAVSSADYYLDSEIAVEQIYPPVLTLTINADLDTSAGDTDLYTHIDFLDHSNNALTWSGVNAPGNEGSGDWVALEDGEVSLSLSLQDVLSDTLSALELLLYGPPGLHVGLDLDIDLNVNGFVYNTGLDFEFDLFDGDSILDIPLAELTLFNYIIASSALTLDEENLEFSAGLLDRIDDTFLDDAINASENSDEVEEAIYDTFDFSIF